MIRGITVQLLQLSRAGDTPAWTPVTVENVLVAPVLEVDNHLAYLPDGHRAVYHLGIPKTDGHSWEGQLVQFFGATWAVVGIPTKGIDGLIPGPWNTKVTVELYRSAAPDVNSLWCDTVQLLSGSAAQDPEGYEVITPAAPRSVAAIFNRGIEAEAVTDGDKAGMRQHSIVELWTGDYEGETLVAFEGTTYTVESSKPTGRGTVLLTLREVWR